jgi:hypothetical protein
MKRPHRALRALVELPRRRGRVCAEGRSCPMGRRAASTQESRLGEQERSRTDGRNEFSPIGCLLNPVDRRLVVQQRTRSEPAGDDQNVNWRDGVPRVVRNDAQTTSRNDRRR